MKINIILFVIGISFSIVCFGQDKQNRTEVKDTDTCHVIITVGELKQLLQIINTNIDSKAITKQVVDFLQQKVVLQPARKEQEKEHESKKLNKQ